MNGSFQDFNSSARWRSPYPPLVRAALETSTNRLQLRHCTFAQQGECLQAEEEDAAALANEGQGATAGTGLEASLHNLQLGNSGRVGPGAPPRIPSSNSLDATGELHDVFGADASG